MAKPTTPTTPAKVETPVVNLNNGTPAPAATDATPPQDAPPADGAKDATPPAAPEETSPILIDLQAKEEALQDKIFELGKGAESRKLMAELWEVQKSMENEKVAIQKRKKDLEIEAAKNARVALFDTAVDAKVAEVMADLFARGLNLSTLLPRVPEDKIEEMNTFNATFKTQRETVVNELLTKFGGSSPAKKTGDATSTPSTGGSKKSEEIVSIIAPMYAEGKTGAEVRAAIKMYGGNGAWGYFNDGTANAAILAYEKANHLNGK